MMLEINWDEAVGDPVVLADYIEMAISLDEAHSGWEFTYANFVDYLQDVPFSGDTYGSLDDDDRGERQPQPHFVQGESYIDEPVGFLSGDRMDEMQPYFDDAVALIERRRQWLGDLYPFTVHGNDVRLSNRPERSVWTPYVFLLACSHHNLIMRRPPTLDAEFEKICKEAMKSLCHDEASVFLFSQNSEDRRELGRSARAAIPKLASMLNAAVAHESEIPDTPREFGIDIIAIDKMDDDLGYSLLMTAQCTIASDPSDWERKKAEPKWDGISYFIPYDVPPVTVLFIPHLPRKQADKWSVQAFHLNGSIVCDRYRICRLIQRHSKFPDSCAAQSVAGIVEDFIGRDGGKIAKSNLDRYSYQDE